MSFETIYPRVNGGPMTIRMSCQGHGSQGGPRQQDKVFLSISRPIAEFLGLWETERRIGVEIGILGDENVVRLTGVEKIGYRMSKENAQCSTSARFSAYHLRSRGYPTPVHRMSKKDPPIKILDVSENDEGRYVRFILPEWARGA
jgi:hypothetical protein